MKKTIKQLAAASCMALATCVMAYADAIRPEKDWLVVGGGSRTFDVGEDVRESLDAFFKVSSGSAATIKVTGLPSGLRFDARTQTIAGVPTKRGVYYVTLSAQNGNGYKQTCIAEWNVGNASNGDYDDIGIDWENLENGTTGEPVVWKIGEEVGFCFSLLDAFDHGDFHLVSVSGLPPTLSTPKCRPAGADCGYALGSYVGTLTKPGKYKVTVTAEPSGGGMSRKAVKTIIVQDAGCRYLNVISTTPSRGTVTGSKVYAIGAKASISAKAAKGYYFAGWYRDAKFNDPLLGTTSGDWRKANDSIIVTEDIADTGVYARFVSSGEDNIYIDCDETWNVGTYWIDIIDVQSMTLPTVTVKGLPPGVTWNKWDKSRFALESTQSKLKPGTAVATITAKNLSGHTATRTVRIVVPNLQSWVFDGLDYSDSAYRLMVGVSDLCVDGWFSFGYFTDYKVTASGLPPGLKLTTYDGYACIRGTPTKVGTYTVTLTAKRGNAVEKATFTINIDPLPEYAVGTFNGVLKDKTSGEIVGSFTFTAAATGKQSVKVVTELGTMSLSASAWNCYDDYGRPTAYFCKNAKNEYFCFMLTPNRTAWNCKHQLEGSLSWRKSSTGGESFIEAVIDTAQRNPFGKTGSAYDHPSAVKVAESLASEHKSTKMAIFWDSELDAYRLACAACVLPGFSDGTATLRMNKNGTATVSGKLYGLYSFSATAVLTFDTACGDYGSSYLFGEHCRAVFTPVVKIF